MPRTAQQLVYTTDPTDFTTAINGADSHEAARALLAKKQAALHAGRPPRRARSLEPVQEVDVDVNPDEIKDPGLRRNYERSKAREERREARPAEPVQKPARNGSYAHGMSMAATLEKVCMRPDITWRAKSRALVLSSHWPNVRPSNERLRLLTGLAKSHYRAGWPN